MTQLTEQHRSGYRFDAVFIRECAFRDSSDGEFDQATGSFPQDVEAAVEIRARMDPSEKWGVTSLRLKISPPISRPGLFDSLVVEIEGRFSVVEGNDSVSFKEFLTESAPTILFPYAREAITNITARTRLGPLLIPPMSMIAIMQQSSVASPSEST